MEREGLIFQMGFILQALFGEGLPPMESSSSVQTATMLEALIIFRLAGKVFTKILKMDTNMKDSGKKTYLMDLEHKLTTRTKNMKEALCLVVNLEMAFTNGVMEKFMKGNSTTI